MPPTLRVCPCDDTQARRIWESILNRCRDLARFGALYRDEAGEPRVELLTSLLCAFPRELRAHLVGEPYEDGTRASCDQLGHTKPQRSGNGRLSPPPLPKPIAERLAHVGNRPLYVCKWLANEIKRIPDTETFTSRERLSGFQAVNQLGSYIGACERLLQTPVPLNYARHTSRFLTLWCLTLPISLVDTMGLLVVPVSAFVTWSLFGIQEIGLFIEHCALDNGAVFMDTITELIALDVMEAVEEDDVAEALDKEMLDLAAADTVTEADGELAAAKQVLYSPLDKLGSPDTLSARAPLADSPVTGASAAGSPNGGTPAEIASATVVSTDGPHAAVVIDRGRQACETQGMLEDFEKRANGSRLVPEAV